MSDYYYENHRLLRYYCRYNNISFKTREEYLQYCQTQNINLVPLAYFKRSKYYLESDSRITGTRMRELLAPGTQLFDARDLSNYYFQDIEEARKFENVIGVNPMEFCLVNFYDGYEGEPDYSPEGLAKKYTDQYELIKDSIVWDESKAWKNVAHFIISYLPDYKEGEDNSLRDIRVQAHLDQIKSIKMITPHARIYIVAQNYRDEDYIDDPQIIYAKHPKLGAMRARNEALKLLYNSDYCFGIISDDDAFLAPTQSAIDFYEEVERHPEKFDSVDIVHPRDIYHAPCKLENFAEDNPANKNWVFTWVPCALIHWTLFRNFKKYDGQEEYQDLNIDPTKGMGADDLEFELGLFTKGRKIFTLSCLQLITLNCFLNTTVVYKEVKDNPWTRHTNLENTRKKFYKTTQVTYAVMERFREENNHPSSVSIARDRAVNMGDEYYDKNSEVYRATYRRLQRMGA